MINQDPPRASGKRPASQWRVGPELAGARLAAALHLLGGVSWGRARSWVATGKIHLDGKLCLDANRLLRSDELIEFYPNARRPAPLLDSVAAAIVYLDDHLVVVDKPPNINTVPFDGERDTLDVIVQRAVDKRERSQRRQKRSARGWCPKLSVVHRLDRETSGLLVFARSWLAKQRLSEQFRAHDVRRHYLAIAHGTVASQTIRSHLLRDRGDGLRGSRERATAARQETIPAKLAITHVELLEKLAGASLVRCRLETGRTHQIRIHLGELGHPLLGESAYKRDFRGDPLPASRLMLHAAELGFRHPASGELVHWELPLPDDMQGVLVALRANKA